MANIITSDKRVWIPIDVEMDGTIYTQHWNADGIKIPDEAKMVIVQSIAENSPFAMFAEEKTTGCIFIPSELKQIAYVKGKRDMTQNFIGMNEMLVAVMTASLAYKEAQQLPKELKSESLPKMLK